MHIASAAGIRATLHDRFGQRLLAAETADTDTFRLVKTLAPGLYFVRVSAPPSTTADYRLRIE